MAKKAATKNAGRPKGAKTGAYDQAETVATQCRKCGSSERVPYFGTTESRIAGQLPDGRRYTHVVWRRTRCAGCGQCRSDKTFENRP
jgi:hypothetical protein